MKCIDYFKRMIKYILYDFKQPQIYVNCIEREKSTIHKDKIVLITGGNKGLGLSIAKRMSKDGANVIITGRNEQDLKKAVNEIGNNSEYRVLDLTIIEDVNNIVDDIFMKYGKIDILINNAGVSMHEKDFLDITEDSYDIQLDTNLKGSLFLTKRFINNYKKNNQKEAAIIFISSERGSMCDYLPYGLSKVAINSLTEALSLKYYREGIRVNAIAPGVTASQLTKINKNDDLYSNRASGRTFIPEEMAEIVSYICSDYSKCISGEIINCDVANHLKAWFE